MSWALVTGCQACALPLSGVVYNGLNVAAVKDLRHQTVFFSATVDQVVSVLSGALEELKKRNPDVKVVITVSPVPMAQTFTDSDVFAANTYSKSVLRVASDALKGNFEFVDYFPKIGRASCRERVCQYV